MNSLKGEQDLKNKCIELLLYNGIDINTIDLNSFSFIDGTINLFKEFVLNEYGIYLNNILTDKQLLINELSQLLYNKCYELVINNLRELKKSDIKLYYSIQKILDYRHTIYRQKNYILKTFKDNYNNLNDCSINISKNAVIINLNKTLNV
ncbi:MAG: hypothetical protein AABY22_30605, partial [Nanoarchaeota archaeon]